MQVEREPGFRRESASALPFNAVTFPTEQARGSASNGKRLRSSDEAQETGLAFQIISVCPARVGERNEHRLVQIKGPKRSTGNKVRTHELNEAAGSLP